MSAQCQRYECTDRARYVWGVAVGWPGPILCGTVLLCGTCSKGMPWRLTSPHVEG